MSIVWKKDVCNELAALGWTQQELYKNKIIVGESYEHLRTGRMVGIVVLARICALLQCQPGDLLQYNASATLPTLSPKETARDRVRKWIAEHPDSQQYNCAKELGLSRTLVNRYWHEFVTTPSPKETSRDRVRKWIAEHPDGRQCDCAQELGICPPSVNRYWHEFVTTPSPKETSRDRVRKWIAEHPDGRQCDCAQELSLSRTSVNYYWHELDSEN